MYSMHGDIKLCDVGVCLLLGRCMKVCHVHVCVHVSKPGGDIMHIARPGC